MPGGLWCRRRLRVARCVTVLIGCCVADAVREFDELYAELCWRRAKSDPAFFMRELMWVQSQRDERGREPFVLFDYQESDLQTFLVERFAIVLKARQLGLSTLVAGYALWLVLFRPGSNIIWVSNNQDNANKAVAMLEVAWHFLPEWAKQRAPEQVSNATQEKAWLHPDGMQSKIKARAGTKTGAASETATLVVLDEFALVDPVVQNDLYRSASPTTDAGGSLIIISTARGRHNRFAKMFLSARQKTSRFVPVFHPWFLSRFVNSRAHLVAGCASCGGRGWMPEVDNGSYCTACVDMSVYEAKRADFPDEPWLHRAEYPATEEEAFRESGRPRFAWLPTREACVEFGWRGLVELDDHGRSVLTPDPLGPLRLSEEGVVPDPDRDYVLSIDPSTGTGGDYTAMTVAYKDEEGNPVRVAFWHANMIEPSEASAQAVALGKMFTGRSGPAKIVVETQGGYGGVFVDFLVRSSYPRIYRHRYEDRRKRKRRETYGLPMQASRKPLVIDTLASYLRPLDGSETGEAMLGGVDVMLLSELESFVNTPSGKVQADTGCHDDLVMSTAIAVWVLHDKRESATPSASSEGTFSSEPVFSVQHIFEQAERVRVAEAKQLRMSVRRSRRRVTTGGRL